MYQPVEQAIAGARSIQFKCEGDDRKDQRRRSEIGEGGRLGVPPLSIGSPGVARRSFSEGGVALFIASPQPDYRPPGFPFQSLTRLRMAK